MTYLADIQSLTAAERGDELLEAAHKALVEYAQHELKRDFNDGGYERGSDALQIALRLKALRRPVVVKRMDAERLAKVGAS